MSEFAKDTKPASNAWICLSCNLRNSSNDICCRQCQAQNPIFHHGWIRSSCHFFNDGEIVYCGKCGTCTIDSAARKDLHPSPADQKDLYGPKQYSSVGKHPRSKHLRTTDDNVSLGGSTASTDHTSGTNTSTDIFDTKVNENNGQKMSSMSLPTIPPSRQQKITTGFNRLPTPLRSNTDSKLQQIIVPDLLTVFQAAPLAYTDAKGSIHPMPALGFETEQEVLTKAISDATVPFGKKIDVDFKIATTDTLGLFLAQEQGQLMHFSCHGHKNYLALEDGCGGMQCLPAQKLQNWIAVGSRDLHFVFVSACHSELIGQAFVAAGVPHVVCCRHDSELRESAAVEFERIFYRNLACGTKNLQQAFDIAKQEILLSPRLPEKHSLDESRKYCLLPANRNHAVPVFFRKDTALMSRPKIHIPPITFPLPPKRYMGRQLEQYRIVSALSQCRLLRVSGCRGVGKSDLVKVCCLYLNQRLPLFDLHQIVWHDIAQCAIPKPSLDKKCRQMDDISRRICSLEVSQKKFLHDARPIVSSMIRELSALKTLLVIEAKELSDQDSAGKLSSFIESMIEGTKHLKILVIHRFGYEVKTSKLSCRDEQVVCVERLSLEQTVYLFGFLLPPNLIEWKKHGVSTAEDLCDLLLEETTDLSTKRMQSIYKLVGEGNPAEIHEAAKNMTPEKLVDLIALGRQNGKDYELLFSSRAALTRKQEFLQKQILELSQEKKFKKCEELQSLLNDLESQKAQLPDVHKLKKDSEKCMFDLEIAVLRKDWRKADFLRQELDRLDASIQLEQDVEAEHNAESFETEIMTTRVALEAKLLQLEKDYSDLMDIPDFKEATKIDQEMKRLVTKRPLKPTKDELVLEVRNLKSEYGLAKQYHRITEAEKIYKRLVKVKAQLESEEQAESILGQIDADATSPPQNTSNDNTIDDSERSMSTLDTKNANKSAPDVDEKDLSNCKGAKTVDKSAVSTSILETGVAAPSDDANSDTLDDGSRTSCKPFTKKKSSKKKNSKKKNTKKKKSKQNGSHEECAHDEESTVREQKTAMLRIEADQMRSHRLDNLTFRERRDMEKNERRRVQAEAETHSPGAEVVGALPELAGNNDIYDNLDTDPHATTVFNPEEVVEAKLVTSALSDNEALEAVIMETIMKNTVNAEQVKAVPSRRKRFGRFRKFFKPWKR